MVSASAPEPQQPTVLAERRGPVLVLTLNRPDRLNAWTDELEDRYFALLDEAEADPEVRAIVLTGAGRGFCAGADMAELQRIGAAQQPAEDAVDVPAEGAADASPEGAADVPAEGAADVPDGQSPGAGPPRRERPRWFPLTLRKPLIAAVNGAAAGLGLVQALYCDIRFSTPDAKFTTAFARRGLIAEYGVAWLLPRLIGPSRALDLLLSGRVLRGTEAYETGLVNKVVAADRILDEAVAYATELATWSSPTSMSVMKQQVYEALDTDFPTAAARSEALMLDSFRHPDAAEGVTSYLERRPPAFGPLGPK
ncbi:enoyl-CoA hydratase-related protein [Streptomyces monticola]|uniref:Enoyl-CoA hydratase-related protein n=1 Tax=Streptomyces monticola TaxID=2666263 RepID=A0ABW2JFP0_9ACTN